MWVFGSIVGPDYYFNINMPLRKQVILVVTENPHWCGIMELATHFQSTSGENLNNDRGIERGTKERNKLKKHRYLPVGKMMGGRTKFCTKCQNTATE